MNTEPHPRKTSALRSAVISLYSASFLFFFLPWMQGSTATFWVRFFLLFAFTCSSHFGILYVREHIYNAVCRLMNKRARFFEFPYFVILCLFYFLVFEILPFATGLISIPDTTSIFRDENLTMYILFSGGAGLVACAISGFDVYPVNHFRTRGALDHLIGITRDLMRVSNRTLLVVTSAIIVGWVFKKVEFSLPIIYLTAYGVLGFALGGTAVLGSRLTELLYELSDLEQQAGGQCTYGPDKG